MKHVERLSREELLKLIQVHAKYWLANEVCFFLSGEKEFCFAGLSEFGSTVNPQIEVKSGSGWQFLL